MGTIFTVFRTTPQRLSAAFLLALTPIAPGQDGELPRLLSRALESSPRIAAAGAAAEQVRARLEAEYGFVDPDLYAGSGWARDTRGLPGSGSFEGLQNNAVDARAGVTAALEPGAYVSVGVAERYLLEPGGGERLFQSLLGVRLQVPLLRDRGFTQWDVRRARALSRLAAAEAMVTHARQALTRDITVAYIGVQQSHTSLLVARRATERFRALLAEARDLARLDVVPDYQVRPAEMELQLRLSDETAAAEAYETGLVRLWRLVGDGRDVTVEPTPDRLVIWARKAELPEDWDTTAACRARGSFRGLLCLLREAEAEKLAAADDLRDDVSLNVGASWQGENPGDPRGEYRILSERNIGGEVALVWRRSLHRRRDRARLVESTEQIREIEEELRAAGIDIDAELRSAALSVSRARERLDIITRAVEAADRTVEAEKERFRLGEGRSRFVLDAEKDHTAVMLRQARAAADLLRAHAAFHFQSGYLYFPDRDAPSEPADRRP